MVRADFFPYRARAKSAISLGRGGGGTMGMQNRFNWHEPHTTSGPHVPSRLPRVELEIIRGRARDRVRPVESRTYLIGSAVDCDLVLADAQFADVHAYLLRDPRGAIVRWLGCDPDLTVNGRLAKALVRLADGDRLRTGPYEFKVHIRWPAGAERAATAPASLKLFAEPAKRPPRSTTGPVPAAKHAPHHRALAGLDLKPSGGVAAIESLPPEYRPRAS